MISYLKIYFKITQIPKLLLSSQQAIILTQSNSYAKAMNYIAHMKIKQAIIQIKYTLLQIETHKSIHIAIFLKNKLSTLFKLTNNYKQWAETLKEIYFMNLAHKGFYHPSNQVTLMNLMNAYIYYDTKKAHSLCLFLQQQMNEYQSGIQVEKIMLFYRSILFSIEMKFQKSIKDFERCLDLQTQQDMKHLIKNNLYITRFRSIQHSQEYQDKKQRISLLLPHFQNLVKEIEVLHLSTLKKRNQTHIQKINKLINKTSYANRQLILQSDKSCIVCQNIGQLLYSNQSYQNSLVWFNCAVNSSKGIYRVLRSILYQAAILKKIYPQMNEVAQMAYIKLLLKTQGFNEVNRPSIMIEYLKLLKQKGRLFQYNIYHNQMQDMIQKYKLSPKMESILLPDNRQLF